MFDINPLKQSVKSLLYLSRISDFLHKIRNKNNLCVVMFHRVLPVTDIRWQSCDPEWTMSVDIFDQCIVFFKKHYNVISLTDIHESCCGGDSLPERPLLITFDDGWADNEEYALPVLQHHNVPAVIFVVADAIGSLAPFWEEHLFAVWKTKVLPATFCDCLPEEICTGELMGENDLRNLISIINHLPFDEKQCTVKKIIRQLPKLSGCSMLTASQLCHLIKEGIDLGSHGASHSPLQHVSDLEEELGMSKEAIEKLHAGCGRPCQNICLSFPHGSYNNRIVEKAFDFGYKLLFTSDPCLVPLSSGRLGNKILGRISIPQHAIVEGDALSESRLAFWLMNRPVKSL